MESIELVMIFTVAALDFAVVARRVWADQLMPDPHLDKCALKQRLSAGRIRGKSVCKFKTVVRLNTLNRDAAPFEPFHAATCKVSG